VMSVFQINAIDLSAIKTLSAHQTCMYVRHIVRYLVGTTTHSYLQDEICVFPVWRPPS